MARALDLDELIAVEVAVVAVQVPAGDDRNRGAECLNAAGRDD